MNRKSRLGVCLLTLTAVVLLPAQVEEDADSGIPHAECALFAPGGDEVRLSGLTMASRDRYALSSATVAVMNSMSSVKAGAPRTADIFDRLDQLPTIDRHIFQKIKDAGATPAPKSSDYEFIRRVTLDLTGRIPSYDQVVQFQQNPDPGKRARLIDGLLESPAWVDKWGMFFGDLFENVDNNDQFRRYPEGRNAFYQWIRKSLAANKPYNQMITELLTATGDNSFEQGELNWLAGAMVTGGPVQDNWDRMAGKAADQFLGLTYLDCVLCHNGRRHLDLLSVWGSQMTRRESWELAAFFAKTNPSRIRTGETRGTLYYWRVAPDNPRLRDYALNTTTGNRPERQPIGSVTNITPAYPFADGGSPAAGENYREALARLMTADIQFARAITNNIWKHFFARGIVDPVNQFDLYRLDPANPPPQPWTIQPSHPELLDALARDFQDGGFNLRALMRQIANSEAYQLSARYEGNWKPEYEKLFARKLVRRLWAEEIFDAIVQVSNLPQPHVVNGGLGTVAWAMQLPETRSGGDIGSFLNSFLRGNRVDEDRRSDGAIGQALNLMNDRFVHNRTRATGTGPAASLARRLLTKYTAANNRALIDEMFVTVLSRLPSTAEADAALKTVGEGITAATRQQRVEDLLWSLYNKVDFVYNY